MCGVGCMQRRWEEHSRRRNICSVNSASWLGNKLRPLTAVPKCLLLWKGSLKTNLLPFHGNLHLTIFTMPWIVPFAGSGVDGIDTLRFLAGCRKSRLNQALSVLSLSLGFLSVSAVLVTRATFCVVLFVCSVSWLFLLGCQYQCRWLTGKTYVWNECVCGRDVKPYSLTPWIAELLPLCHLQNFGLGYLECAMIQNLPMLYVRKLYRYTGYNSHCFPRKDLK